MIFLLILVAVFALDYAVKNHVEKHKMEGQEKTALGGTILIRRLSNYGAAGSLLEKKPEVVKWSSGIMILLLGIQFIKELFQKGNTGLKICYSFILGGGLSNLYDRIKKGAVTDYFSFMVPFKKLRNLVFNISDIFIIIGSTAMVFFQLRRKNKE